MWVNQDKMFGDGESSLQEKKNEHTAVRLEALADDIRDGDVDVSICRHGPVIGRVFEFEVEYVTK